MLYEILTVSVRPGTQAEALRIIGTQKLQRKGATLLGFWTTELGLLNQLVSLWSHAELSDDRAGIGMPAEAPWIRAIGGCITDVTSEFFRQFPFLPEIVPGAYGAFYEMRSYRLKFDAVPLAIQSWVGCVEARSKLSPLTTALYPIGGSLMRYVHIWPYQSLEQRLQLRTLAAEKGIWPPPGGVDLLTAQEVWIMLPAPFSPLR